jgi:nitroreductase
MTDTYTMDELLSAAASAVRAPSMHNSQPWRFRLRDGGIDVCVDRDRLPAIPAREWAARISCGAAVFTLRLALAVAGKPAVVRLRPYPLGADVAAHLVPDDARPATRMEQTLYDAIERRHSNRAPFWATPVPGDVRFRLVQAARAEGAWLEMVIGASAVGAIAEITNAANRVLDRQQGYVDEIARWTRHEPARDGVHVAAAGYATEPQDLLPQRAFGARTRAPGRDYEPEPLVAVLGSAGDTDADQVNAGQALQRVLLTATDAGLAASMLSQPIEVAAAREQLRLALGRYGTPQMVMRIGYGQPGFPTPRRDVAEVVETM